MSVEEKVGFLMFLIGLVFMATEVLIAVIGGVAQTNSRTIIPFMVCFIGALVFVCSGNK